MRKRWQQVHGWTQQNRRGQMRAAEQAAGEAELQPSFHKVAWQQVFPTRKNSHLVHIRSLDPEPEEFKTPVNERQRIAAEIKARAVEDEQHVASERVEAEEPYDANPWLRMTRWARYLADVHFQDLVDVVATPDAEVADPVSRATRVVWDTMAQLARRSQQTVKHCGNGIRMAAVSTMPNRTPFQPLRAYMDETSIQKHAQPWQQILLFIIHTQTEWPWRQKKPQYVMTARQRKTWQRLWQLARQPAADQAGDALASRASPDPMAPDLDHSRIEAFVMTPLETACLEFCIELLNQKTKVHEYESPLVCATAVLGRGEQGWRDPDSYPPIISRVLKVTRFLVVQKALWLDPQHWEIIQWPQLNRARGRARPQIRSLGGWLKMKGMSRALIPARHPPLARHQAMRQCRLRHRAAPLAAFLDHGCRFRPGWTGWYSGSWCAGSMARSRCCWTGAHMG
jgi:hypothetical protein